MGGGGQDRAVKTRYLGQCLKEHAVYVLRVSRNRPARGGGGGAGGGGEGEGVGGQGEEEEGGGRGREGVCRPRLTLYCQPTAKFACFPPAYCLSLLPNSVYFPTVFSVIASCPFLLSVGYLLSIISLPLLHLSVLTRDTYTKRQATQPVQLAGRRGKSN